MDDTPSEIVAYIDESGCSGAKYDQGSSEFLIMAAIAFRAAREEEVLSAFDEARSPQMQAAGKKFRKFSKCIDRDRFALTKTMAEKPLRVFQVAIHKPSLEGSYIRDHHGHEYNYLFKMLLERLSWFVRDLYDRRVGPGRNVRIVLSEQRMYPYSEMVGYMYKLENGKARFNCSVEWPFVNKGLEVTPHENETPIHLADFAASALAMACEPKAGGMTDDRFERNLRKALYRRETPHGRALHGLKIFPKDAAEKLSAEGRLEFLKLIG